MSAGLANFGKTLLESVAERATGDAVSNLNGTLTVSIAWLESFMHEAQIVASPVWSSKALVAQEEAAHLRAVNADLLAALQSLDAERGNTFHKPAGAPGFDAVVIRRDLFDRIVSAAIAKATGSAS